MQQDSAKQRSRRDHLLLRPVGVSVKNDVGTAPCRVCKKRSQAPLDAVGVPVAEQDPVLPVGKQTLLGRVKTARREEVAVATIRSGARESDDRSLRPSPRKNNASGMRS